MANDVAPAGAFVLLRGMTRLTSAGGSSLPSRLFSLRSPCDPCPASWVELKNAEDAGAELILENDRELAARSPGDIGGRSNNGDVGGTAEAMRGVARGGARGEKEGGSVTRFCNPAISVERVVSPSSLRVSPLLRSSYPLDVQLALGGIHTLVHPLLHPLITAYDICGRLI